MVPGMKRGGGGGRGWKRCSGQKVKLVCVAKRKSHDTFWGWVELRAPVDAMDAIFM